MDAQTLKAHLECLICFLVPKAKIFSCCNGHKICESCHKKIKYTTANYKQCPQGGCRYNKPPHRLRDLEVIIDNSDVKVNCSKAGCEEEMPRTELVIMKSGASSEMFLALSQTAKRKWC